MAFFIARASRVGCAQLVLVLLTCCLWVTHAHTANGVLSSDSSSSDDDDYEIIVEPSDLSSSSSDMLSADEPVDSVDSSYVECGSGVSKSSGVSSSSDVSDELSSDPSSMSSASSSSGIDLSEMEGPSADSEEDPPYVPPTDYEEPSSSSSSSSSDDYPQSLEKQTVKLNRGLAGVSRRQHREEADSHKGKPGRPPAVFSGPREEDGTTSSKGHGKGVVPTGGEGGTDSAVQKPATGRRPEQANSEDPSSKRPGHGRRWGGPPSIQRRKELRTADMNYLDLYLCGQFFTETADDFAVVSFNYAGRTQPFSPCSELGSTSDTTNYIYRTALAHRSALQQVVDDLPAAWERYTSEKGAAPRTVHVFTVNMPASVDDISSLLELRRSTIYRSSTRFILGYLNQPMPASDSARGFLNMLREMSRAAIYPIRVCGRCDRVAGYPSGGRRHRDMQFGMSVVSNSEASTDAQCLPIQEHSIPGADLTRNTCDSFQKSAVRCILRSIERRCGQTDTGTKTPKRIDSDEVDLISDLVNLITHECVVDSDCWHGNDRYDIITPKLQNHCNISGEAVGKMFVRCAAAAENLPLDIELLGLERLY